MPGEHRETEFESPASPRSARLGYGEDKCVPKLEFGNEGEKPAETSNMTRRWFRRHACNFIGAFASLISDDSKALRKLCCRFEKKVIILPA